jgi:hypothetical protein
MPWSVNATVRTDAPGSWRIRFNADLSVRGHAKAVQPIERGRRRRLTDDLVVGGVPAGKSAFEHIQLMSPFMNHHQDRLGHRDRLSTGRRLPVALGGFGRGAGLVAAVPPPDRALATVPQRAASRRRGRAGRGLLDQQVMATG